MCTRSKTTETAQPQTGAAVETEEQLGADGSGGEVDSRRKLPDRNAKLELLKHPTWLRLKHGATADSAESEHDNEDPRPPKKKTKAAAATSTPAKQYGLRSATRRANSSYPTSQPQQTDTPIPSKLKRKAKTAKMLATSQRELSETVDATRAFPPPAPKSKRSANGPKLQPLLKITAVPRPPARLDIPNIPATQALPPFDPDDDRPALRRRAASVRPEAALTSRQPTPLANSQANRAEGRSHTARSGAVGAKTQSSAKQMKGALDRIAAAYGSDNSNTPDGAQRAASPGHTQPTRSSAVASLAATVRDSISNGKNRTKGKAAEPEGARGSSSKQKRTSGKGKAVQRRSRGDDRPEQSDVEVNDSDDDEGLYSEDQAEQLLDVSEDEEAEPNDNEDLDLLAAEGNPSKMKNILAAEEVRLTLLSSEGEEDDVDDYVPAPAASDSESESEKEPDGYSSEPVVQPQRRIVKLSKRVGKLRAEEPVMHLDEDGQSDSGAEEAEALLLPKSRSRSRSHVLERAASTDLSATAPSLFDFKYSKNHKLLLTRLHPRLANVIRAALDHMEASLYLVDAFPDRVVRHKLSFTFKALETAAQDSEEPEILDKLNADSHWARELMALLETRLSLFRRNVREAALAVVPTHFKLRGSSGKARVDALLDGQRYIFPGDVMRQIDYNKPYLHPVISDVLSRLLWGVCRSFMHEYPETFQEEWEGQMENFMPTPLVMLAATAVHSVILDTQTPNQTPLDFSAKHYGAVYTEHEKSMSTIYKDKPRAYKFMLREIYKIASDGRTCLPNGGGDGNNAIKYMDIDGMQEL